MLPQNPPQPSCSYLPFQLDPAGIQTSKLMCESLVGVDVPATRQKAGSPVSAVVEPGGVKLPPVTDCAAVMVACCSDRLAKLSQVAAAAGMAPATTAASETVERTRDLKRSIMVFLPNVRPSYPSPAVTRRRLRSDGHEAGGGARPPADA